MIKRVSLFAIAAIFGAALFFACGKQSEGSGNAPTYKKDGTSTGNNPHNPPASTT
ncbi:MAG: hypothetical protein IAF38_04990 [Bacteroidia bacterium]|nr:hypothetical protein [Bacteroidia bacterium]